MRYLGFLLLGGLVLGVLLGSEATAAGAGKTPASTRPSWQTQSPTPILAYYYIWFTPTSWNRAKTDLPLLGKYSSDDTNVMRQHIREAKLAGIDGFIVSWKDTSSLTSRLVKLIAVADEEDFHLAIIYQGLDVERKPLDVAKVKHDVEFFAETFAAEEVFQIWDRPVVIISGTWEFSAEEIALITESARSRLYILSSERNVRGIDRVIGHVDGNAYYWSSVNPETFPDYPGKLAAMSAAVHASGGIWIAPFAPGFDARLIGGTTVVERKDGETLRTQYAAAIQSSADALGLISWNEFSENTHIEPSEELGADYVRITAEILGAASPSALNFDSSEPGGTKGGVSGIATLTVMAFLAVVAVLVAIKRGQGASR